MRLRWWQEPNELKCSRVCSCVELLSKLHNAAKFC